MAVVGSSGAGNGAPQALARQRELGVAGEFARQHLGGVDHDLGGTGLDRAEHLLVARHHDVAAQDEIGPGGRDPDGVDVARILGDADVALHRATLLGEAGHVDHPDALALEMRRHADDGADRHDAGATDPGDDDAVGLADRRQRRLGKRRLVRGYRGALAFPELRAFDGHEGRAKALEAGEVLVAARLIDGALAAELGLERLHRHAVRLHAAIAAALADELVDDHAPVGIGKLSALAAPPLLGRAGLVIDQHGAPRDLRKLPLHRVEIVAVMNREALGPFGGGRIFVRLVGDDDDALGALRGNLTGDLRHVEATVVLLAARHRHRVIEQDLVRDVDARCDRAADRHVARVVVGAVADVLKHVRPGRERRLADPVRALSAHLGEAEGRAVHPLDHVVTADARIGAASFRHLGGRIVRTAGAEIGDAHGDVLGLAQDALRLLEPRDPAAEVLVARIFQQALAEADRDVVGVERTLDREQPVAGFVLLADADRLVDGAVQLLAHLHLDQRSLLLDHDDELQAAGEFLQLLLANRPRTRDLVDAQAEIVAADLVEAELVERLAHVEIGLADRDDADPRAAAPRRDGAVEPVGAHEREHGIALVVMQARLHAEHGVVEPDVEPAGRRRVIGRDHDVDAVEAAVDHGGRLDRLVHAFETDPGAGEARHGPAVDAVIDDLLHAGRVQDRDHHVDEVELGLVRGGRRFGRVVVAHQGKHAAVLRRAGEIGVAQRIARAVDARALAVPYAEYAVEAPFAAQLRLLRAPQRRCGQILVNGRLEENVVRLAQSVGALELVVEPAERRAAIARDIAGRSEPGAAVPRLLHQAHAHQRLIAGDEDASLHQVVFVVEGDAPERRFLGRRGFLRRVLEHHGLVLPTVFRRPSECNRTCQVYRGRANRQKSQALALPPAISSRDADSERNFTAPRNGEIWRNAAEN